MCTTHRAARGPGDQVTTRRGRDAAEHDRPRQLAAALGAAGPRRPLPRPRAGGPTPPSGRWSPTASAAWATSGFRVRSQVRPWNGTFADVDRAARSLAAELRARGVGPGSLVVFQLPNWVEAGITFWAAAYVGAVVVPIVHFYGAKEVELHPPGHRARRRRHGRPLRAQRPPGGLGGRAGPAPRAAVARGRRHRRGRPARRGRRRSPPCSTPTRSRARSPPTPTRRRSSGSRRARPATPRASCTRTARSAARPASSTTCSPRAGRPRSPARRSATSSACSTPSSCRCCGCAAGQPGRRLGPGRGPAHDAATRGSASAAAPPTSSPACSTTPTSPTSTWR